MTHFSPLIFFFPVTEWIPPKLKIDVPHNTTRGSMGSSSFFFRFILRCQAEVTIHNSLVWGGWPAVHPFAGGVSPQYVTTAWNWLYSSAFHKNAANEVDPTAQQTCHPPTDVSEPEITCRGTLQTDISVPGPPQGTVRLASWHTSWWFQVGRVGRMSLCTSQSIRNYMPAKKAVAWTSGLSRPPVSHTGAWLFQGADNPFSPKNEHREQEDNPKAKYAKK